MKTLLRGFGCAAALALLCGPSAGLATASTVIGTTTGVFTQPNPTGGPIVYHGAGTNHFDWGKPANIPNSNKKSDPNWLQWDPAAGVSTELETKFLLGKLTFFNGTVETNSVPTSVKLSLNINLTGPETVNETFDFTLGLKTTPNNSGTANGDADYVYFPSNFPNTTFEIGGVSYTLEILGFDDFGGANAIQSNAQQFHVKEQGKAWANLYGMLTAHYPPATVPEPASVISAATAGLVGLGLLARRRRKETIA